MILERRTSFGWPSASGGGWANPTRGLCVHYDGSRQGLARKSHAACRAYWKQTRRFHMGAGRGWSDIGYSFAVCPHGRVMEGRGLNRSQAAQPGGNSTWYSVTFMSGEGEQPTGAQLRAFRELRAWLMGSHGVAGGLRYHGQFISTSCAGSILNAMVRNRSIIKGAVGSGGPPVLGGGWLAKGDRGPAVAAAQSQLDALGYDLGRWGADGIFGDATEDVVRAFQDDHNLSVDGIIGPETAAALEAAAQRKVEQVPDSAEYRKHDEQELGRGEWTLVSFDQIVTRQKSEEGDYYSLAFGPCEHSVTAGLTLAGEDEPESDMGLSAGAEVQLRFVEVERIDGDWQVVRRLPIDSRAHVGGNGHFSHAWGGYLKEGRRLRLEVVQYGQKPTVITGGRTYRHQWRE